MRDGFRMALLAAAALALAGAAVAQTSLLAVAHDADRLPDGSTLITDGGAPPGGLRSHVFLVDGQGRLQWSRSPDTLFVHNGDLLASGHLLVSGTADNHLVEMDASEVVTWDSRSVGLSDGSALRYPNDVNDLGSGRLLVTDRDNHRVFEMDRSGRVLWQFGVTGVAGADLQHLDGPHNADRLADGTTLIADSNNNRVLQVDGTGAVAWSYATGLSWPRDADWLDPAESTSGNPSVLITDSRNNRVIEVDPTTNGVTWSRAGLNGPYDADRLPGGNTLIGDGTGARVLEVDPTGAVVWRFPPLVPLATEALQVTNPTSGASLHCHVHRPADASAANRYPAFVYIPGGNGFGSQQDGRSFYETYASQGFIVLHFDPDGRGLSTGTEDDAGFVHQDGLEAVLEALAARSDVDPDHVGIVSYSFGVTMAAGTLARYADRDLASFLVDWEGPADRDETARANGGHLDHDVSDDPWWAEREARTFMSQVRVRYVRIQSRADHNPRLTDNHHAVELIEAATSTAFGGLGRSPYTRCNNIGQNPENTVFTVASPPLWLGESGNNEAKVIEYLRWLIAQPRPGTGPVWRIGNGLLAAADLSACLAPRVDLAWSEATASSPVTYAVYRSEVAEPGAAGEPPVVSGLTATVWSDVTALCGRTYRYLVRASDSEVPPRSTSGETVLAVTPLCDASAPEPLGGPLLAVKRIPGVVQLHWTASSSPDAVGARLSRAPDPADPTGGASFSAPGTYFDDPVLGDGVAYYYRARALDACGNESP